MHRTGLHGLVFSVTIALSLSLYSSPIRQVSMSLRISVVSKSNNVSFENALLFVRQPSSMNILEVHSIEVTALSGTLFLGHSGFQSRNASLGEVSQPLCAILVAGFQLDMIA